MRLSIFYDHVVKASQQSGKSIAEILSAISDSGIQAVELDLFHLDEPQEHLAYLKTAGIKVACVNAFYSMEKEFNEEQACAHIDAAIRCGADHILVVPGFLSEQEGACLGDVIHDKKETYSFLDRCPSAVRIAEGLARITEMAKSRGISVTIEDFDNTASPVSGLNSMLWYLDKIPDLKCTFDTGNFITHNDDLFEAWACLKERVIHVHCKDRGTGPVAIGGGTLPIARILNDISKDGYKGYTAIEHYGSSDQLGYMLRSAAYISSLGL